MSFNKQPFKFTILKISCDSYSKALNYLANWSKLNATTELFVDYWKKENGWRILEAKLNEKSSFSLNASAHPERLVRIRHRDRGV
jgi:hypothetical protein